MMPEAMRTAMPEALPGAKHATNATQLTGRIQDQGEKTQLPDPCGAVEKPDSISLNDDLARTRALLQRMQAENEHRTAQLDAAGLTSFTDRADWLIDHWSKDQKLAWRRRWERLGLTDPEPHLRRVEHSPQPTRPCERCGIPRVVKLTRHSPLCADCRFVLSKEEIALWAGKKQVA